MITVVDYGMGNLRSVTKAFEHVGSDCRISSKSEEILASEKLVVPGVGHFGDAMDNLRAKNLDRAIVQFVESGKPFLGICLGYQILFESSDESPGSAGLGIFKGKSCFFRDLVADQTVKVPHMGWNSVKIAQENGGRLAQNIPGESFFYFVHSYFVVPEEESIISGTTEYGKYFASMVERGNVFGCQFHPEKSQDCGLQFIKNFEEL